MTSQEKAACDAQIAHLERQAEEARAAGLALVLDAVQRAKRLALALEQIRDGARGARELAARVLEETEVSSDGLLPKRRVKREG